MITSLYAGLLGLIYIGLTFYTIKGRFKHGISLGAGDNEDMEKRIRAHANFAEYVPLALILILLSELGNAPAWSIHLLGVFLVLGRILHAKAINSVNSVNNMRKIGMIMTLLVVLAASILSIIAYF